MSTFCKVDIRLISKTKKKLKKIEKNFAQILLHKNTDDFFFSNLKNKKIKNYENRCLCNDLIKFF